ncbi:MAG TPA: VOC family protein [Spongiibacteraceae bacterium]|jgi:3,4-dihydroxy-9,10-secoandrosta-1,3,5(10)-triene-9,17-dione 4,5-dioxygenase
MAIHSLGYITVQASDLSRWVDYGTKMVGFAVNDAMTQANKDALFLKMDDRPFRFLVEKAGEDRYGASGWEAANPIEFNATIKQLRAAGVTATQGTPAEIALRQVQDLVKFQDPSGNQHELFWGAISNFGRFISPLGVQSFVTGDQGLGHTVLPAPEFDATVKFFTDVLGFGLSDLMKVRFTPDPNEPEKRLYFLHCNRRHHSLALFESPMPSGCVHVMIETCAIDEVGRALDRLQATGTKLTGTLGRHANDHMVSFYMLTPGGFMIEYGADGMTVDDWNRYSSFQSTVNSFWGHDFSVGQR